MQNTHLKPIKLFYLFIIFFTISFTACNTKNSSKKQKTIKLAAAANMRYVLDIINENFEKQSGIKVLMSTASSGKLTAQIENSAPFELFISANKKYPDYLYKKGFALSKPQKICSGILVIWSLNPDILLNKDLSGLCGQTINSLAIANPQTAPFGKAALESFKKSGIYNCLKHRIIYTENVSQISQYVLNNNVDIGITAKAIIMSKQIGKKGKWAEIDTSLYKPIDEYVLLTKNAKNSSNTEKYLHYLFSKQVKRILVENGYRIN